MSFRKDGSYFLFRYFLGLFYLLISFTMVSALPPAPDPPSLVVDFSGLLNGGQRMSLEMKLNEYAKVFGTQISIVSTDDLGGMEPSEFADRLAEAWGVGQAGRENGVMILVNPSKDRQHGRMHISVGYGLEGVIPDIVARKIVDREIIPNFREGRYYEGLDQATTVLMQLASGEFPAEEYADDDGFVLFGLVIFFVVLIFFIAFVLRKRNSHYNPGKDIPLSTWIWLMNNGSKGSQGSWGDFSGGRGSFGGGFGGFGGGRFGGGGAGGSW